MKNLAFTARLLSSFLSREKPLVLALVLGQLDPELAGKVLDGLSGEIRGDVIHRIANIGKELPLDILGVEECQTQEQRIDRPDGHHGRECGEPPVQRPAQPGSQD